MSIDMSANATRSGTITLPYPALCEPFRAQLAHVFVQARSDCIIMSVRGVLLSEALVMGQLGVDRELGCGDRIWVTTYEEDVGVFHYVRTDDSGDLGMASRELASEMALEGETRLEAVEQVLMSLCCTAWGSWNKALGDDLQKSAIVLPGPFDIPADA